MNQGICPQCRNPGGVPIVYGFPDSDLEARAARGEVMLGGCVLEFGQPDVSCPACGSQWRTEDSPIVLEDRVEALGRPCSFWSVQGSDERGAFVDWGDRQLLLRFETSKIVVDAHVARGGWYEGESSDYENGAELVEAIDIELGDAVLLHREADERAWLRIESDASLADACQQAAALAPLVAQALQREFDSDPAPPDPEELFAG